MLDPYKVLGINPTGITLSDLRKAYMRLKELYSEDSLATYSLLTPSQRRIRLESFDNAYKEILAQFGNKDRNVESSQKVDVKETSDALHSPDVNKHPGAYLRWLRQRAGLSIKDVSAKTKISRDRLEDIEHERVEALPETVYLKGYVIEFARCLNIQEPKRFAEIFLGLISNQDKSVTTWK